MPVEQQRQPKPERELKDRGDEGVEKGVVNRDAEDVVVPQLHEIVKTDKLAGDADLDVGDRQHHALDERIGDKEAEQYDRR